MEWTVGRAGMLYADLLPDHAGGQLLVNRIRIPEGGPVGDWVHYHEVAFQLIVVLQGRVRLVYQDQGEPFWAGPGDAIVQPPTIRHQVLETDHGLEVLELVHPAEHTTRADPDTPLPTDELRPDRTFGGQRFLWDRDDPAAWRPHGALHHRPLGVQQATHGVATVEEWRTTEPAALQVPAADGIRVWFVVQGRADIDDTSVPAGQLARSEQAGPVRLHAATRLLCAHIRAR